MGKEKRVLNRWFLVALSAILLVAISIYKVPRYIKETNLKALGYDTPAINSIIKKKVDSEIISNQYYSQYLAEEVQKDSFDKNYLGLYAVTSPVDEKTIALYNRLASLRGYDKEELIQLFSHLKIYALTPLLVYDKVDVDTYLADNDNHSENGPQSFTLTNDYLHGYEHIEQVEDPSSIELYVNKNTDLGEYVPDKLVTISQRYGVGGQALTSEALDAFSRMCDALYERCEGEGIYAVGSYVSFENQTATYKKYGLDADLYTDRPGFSEAQTGLSVQVVSSATASIYDFNTTAAYAYLKEHAHEFGFIERYPNNKESITGQTGNPAYWRYVGNDLAQKIYESGLTFDEYYFFYIYQSSQS